MSIAANRFASQQALGLPYTRGRLLATTEDDYRKLRTAWQIIEERISGQGREAVFNLSGLERGLNILPEDLPLMDDEIAPALYIKRMTELALEHLGGDPKFDDVFVFTRLSAATLAAHMVLARPGSTVVGIAVGHSHPSVLRAAALAGADFVDVADPDELRATLADRDVSLVVLTRLSVSYEFLPPEWIEETVAAAQAAGVPVLADDAGGARVGPAILDLPRTLELGVDVGVTGLDKYGVNGPRLGLMAGKRELVASIRARAFEYALEARPMLYPAVVRTLEGYDPAEVVRRVELTRATGEVLRERLGARVHETPVTTQLLADDIVAIALERSGLTETEIVPYEASAALAMLLLRRFGVLTVHFVGMPPGTSALLLKFLAPGELERFGGPGALAAAVDTCLDELSTVIASPQEIQNILFSNEGGSTSKN